MRTRNSEEGLFRCDHCGYNISPNAPLILAWGKHYCCLQCYSDSLNKSQLALDLVNEIQNAHPSTFVPPG
jgi:hypothetical protein